MIPDPTTTPTIGADELADLLSVSPWLVYKQARVGECPICPNRVGGRLRWPTVAVQAILGLPGGSATPFAVNSAVQGPAEGHRLGIDNST